jgi:hypothetical protein
VFPCPHTQRADDEIPTLSALLCAKLQQAIADEQEHAVTDRQFKEFTLSTGAFADGDGPWSADIHVQSDDGRISRWHWLEDQYSSSADAMSAAQDRLTKVAGARADGSLIFSNYH